MGAGMFAARTRWVAGFYTTRPAATPTHRLALKARTSARCTVRCASQLRPSCRAVPCAGYTERVLLLYDGLHYDAMAVAAFEGAPEDLDVTIIDPSSQLGAAVGAAAAGLVAASHAARQFTDTANFTLRCGVCQLGLKGEKEAVEHAKATGHSNFSEY